MGALFLLWSLLGLVHTGFALAGEHGWAPVRTAAARSTMGLPDNLRAPLVARTRDALARAPEAARVVVVLPADADSTDVLYVRYQLAHLEYPRRIRVVRDGAGVVLPEVPPAGTAYVFAHRDASGPFPLRRAGEAPR